MIAGQGVCSTFTAFLRRSGNATTAWTLGYRADWMLQLLRQSTADRAAGIDPLLRWFACWCARDIGAAPEIFPALGAAEAFSDGAIRRPQMVRAREHAAGEAAAALSVGVSGWHPIACAQLAAFHASADSALDAAEQSSRFNALARGFRFAAESARQAGARDHAAGAAASTRTWGEAHRALVDRVQAEAYRRQAPVLRFILEQPFLDGER